MKSKNFFIDVLALLIVISLFTLVLLKYYDEPREVVLEKAGVSKLYVGGYDVSKYVDENKIHQAYLEYELPQDYNLVIDENKIYTNSVPILNYHGLTPAQGDVSDLNYGEFQEQLFALKKAGYETVSLDDLYLFLRDEKKLPEKSFMITFDDGRRDSYYYADSVLQELNYTAVMFVVAKYSLEQNSNYYLSYDELLDMKKSGRWELQSHSYSGHRTVQIDENGSRDSFFGNKLFLEEKGRLENDNEYENRISIDLLRAKYLLEEKFGHEIHSFAIPFSDFGQHTSNYERADEISEKIYSDIYKMVFYQYKPLKDKDFKANYNDKRQDFYFVMRITVDPNTPAFELLKEIEATDEVELPYEEDFSNEYRWLRNWGEIEFGSDSLVLKNSNVSRTTLSYLDGSYLWQNYSVRYKVDESSNQTLSALVRFQNANDYVSCSIRSQEAVIEMVGSDFVPLKEPLPFNVEDEYELRVDVIGNKVTCYINDNIVNEAIIKNMHSYGGVGLRTSLDIEYDFGKSVVSSISVKNLGK